MQKIPTRLCNILNLNIPIFVNADKPPPGKRPGEHGITTQISLDGRDIVHIFLIEGNCDEKII